MKKLLNFFYLFYSIVPKQAIKPEDACLIVCFAGEIYREIQGAFVGTRPDEWQRVIAEVDTFRTKYLKPKDTCGSLVLNNL
jgi:hypothetical protein